MAGDCCFWKAFRPELKVMTVTDNTVMNRMLPPLPERMRPETLDQYVGQRHLVGKGSILWNMIHTGNLSSFILWGPPGVGKTTLARIVAHSLDREFHTLSAVSAGVKDVRDVIDRARDSNLFSGGSAPVLFIDEIHRFSKSQQDALLGAVEDGTVILIGATTENPSFEVISPLLSRCQVFVLKPLEPSDLEELLNRAIHTDEILRTREISVTETGALFRHSGGDARKLLNILEIVTGSFSPDEKIVIDNKVVTACLQENIAFYDKGRVSGDRTRMPPYIIWQGCWPVVKTLFSSPADCASWRRKTSDLPIPMHCCWPMPVSRSCIISVCQRQGYHSPRQPSILLAHRRAIRRILQ